MEFSPINETVKRCLQAQALKEAGETEKSETILEEAWEKSVDDSEKFLVSFFFARHKNSFEEKLKWLKTSLDLAIKIDDDTVKDALPSIYADMAGCYSHINDRANAEKYNQLSKSFSHQPTDKGPFYHGTRADLQIGDFLVAGKTSNYSSDLLMNHIYFTALANGAGLAAALANGKAPERVYIVEPTGAFESDPNVTNKKFPGNPTRSYRTTSPLKIVGQVEEWEKMPPEEFQKWREKLENNKGEIIN